MTGQTSCSDFARAAMFALIAALGLQVSACQEEPRLRVASKNFAESMILAEMVALMAEEKGIAVTRSIPYGGTFLTFEGIKQDKIDVYPEYTGVGLAFTGQPALTDAELSYARVGELFGQLGITWQKRFGFGNDYVLVMTPGRARSLGVSKISDLAALESVRFVTEDNFPQRPLDGLGPLVRRYGLSQGESITIEQDDEDYKDQIVQALMDGRSDVGELFSTDGHVVAFELVVLEDDLNFFPVYEAAPVVRTEALERFPALGGALDQLGGTIDSAAMAGMVAEVDIEGRDYAAVAKNFLIARNLLKEDAISATADRLEVAIGNLDSLAGLAGQAVRAARAAFTKRAVSARRYANPLEAVVTGKARIAVASAPDFYRLEGSAPVLATDAEAVGVLGRNTAHFVTRADGPESLLDIAALGVGQERGVSARVAEMVLAALGLTEQVTLVSDGDGGFDAQVQALQNGRVDAIVMVAPQGEQAIVDIMARGGVKLMNLEEWSGRGATLRFTFLRPARVAANTYPGQTRTVETIDMQVVLAGPSSQREEFGGAGPGTTGSTATQPLSGSTIETLTKALATQEVVDPAIPIAAALRPKLVEETKGFEWRPWLAFTNLVAILFLIWCFYLFLAPEPRREGEVDGDA